MTELNAALSVAYILSYMTPRGDSSVGRTIARLFGLRLSDSVTAVDDGIMGTEPMIPVDHIKAVDKLAPMSYSQSFW